MARWISLYIIFKMLFFCAFWKKSILVLTRSKYIAIKNWAIVNYQKPKKGSGGLMDKVSASQPQDCGFKPLMGHDYYNSYDISTGRFQEVDSGEIKYLFSGSINIENELSGVKINKFKLNSKMWKKITEIEIFGEKSFLKTKFSSCNDKHWYNVISCIKTTLN